jgi:hypothetical protein
VYGPDFLRGAKGQAFRPQPMVQFLANATNCKVQISDFKFANLRFVICYHEEVLCGLQACPFAQKDVLTLLEFVQRKFIQR